METRVILFSNFLEQQKEKHHVPDYDLDSTADLYHMMKVYSDFEGRSPIQPNFYVSMYYMIKYIISRFPGDFKVRIFEYTESEKKEFAEAYRVFAEGRNYKEAERKMGSLVQKGHLEALALYPEILGYLSEENKSYYEEYHEKAGKQLDPVELDDFPGMLALCFEQNTRALARLAHIFDSKYKIAHATGLPEVDELAELLLNWLLLIYTNRIEQDPNDGYTMVRLREDIYSKGLMKEPTLKEYWRRRTVAIKYAPEEIKEVASIHRLLKSGSGFTSNISLAEKYARDAYECGIFCGKTWMKEFDYMRIHGVSYSSGYVSPVSMKNYEPQMQEYRRKLDSRETWVNYFTQGTAWTNREDQLFGWLTQDYDRYYQGAALEAMRERKEQDYLKKLRKADEDKAYSAMIDAEYRQNMEAAHYEDLIKSVRPVKGRVITELAIMNPPTDELENPDGEFYLLYSDCNKYRQMHLFLKAEDLAEELIMRCPNSHTAHWMHFLAVHGIVFIGNFDMYRIERMSRNTYFHDEDYFWLRDHAPWDAWVVYKRYIYMFDQTRRDYWVMGLQMSDTQIVLCYRHKDDEGEETFASAIVHSLRKTGILEGREVFCAEEFDYAKRDAQRDAIAYQAGRSAFVMVLVADTEEDLRDPGMLAQWSRYAGWASCDDTKTLIAVSLGALAERYKEYTDTIYSLKDTDDVAELSQAILAICDENQKKRKEQTLSLADRIIYDHDMVPNAEEVSLPMNERREAMQKRARDHFCKLQNSCRDSYHKKDDNWELKKKGIFKKELTYEHKYDHHVSIRENGTVEASTDRLEYPYGSAEIAQKIGQLRDIKQVAALAHGIVALDRNGHAYYAGQKPNMQAQLEKIDHVIEISHGYDSVFALTEDGMIAEVKENEIQVRIEEGAEYIYAFMDHEGRVSFGGIYYEKMKGYRFNLFIDSNKLGWASTVTGEFFGLTPEGKLVCSETFMTPFWEKLSGLVYVKVDFVDYNWLKITAYDYNGDEASAKYNI